MLKRIELRDEIRVSWNKVTLSERSEESLFRISLCFCDRRRATTQPFAVNAMKCEERIVLSEISAGNWLPCRNPLATRHLFN
jgi:hypothetical protein